MQNLALFSGTSHPELAAEVAKCLQTGLGKIAIQRFPDGEISIHLLEEVRGRNVFAFQSIAREPNDQLIELLIMIDALKRASAKSITAVIPYFAYCRQDRKDTLGAPITARLVANLLESAGATHVLTVDLHSGPVEGFFNVPIEQVFFRETLAQAFMKDHKTPVVVVPPDLGATILARDVANRLKTEIAIISKVRHSASKVEVVAITGDVKEKDVLLADDMCSTARTLVSAAKACQERGAKRIFALATHGLLVEDAVSILEESPIEALYISNSVPATQSILDCKKIRIVSLAAPLSQLIGCMLS